MPTGLVRDYTLAYHVDTTQAVPGFNLIRAGLDMIQGNAGKAKVQVDLLDQALINMGTAATGAAGQFNTLNPQITSVGAGMMGMVTHTLAVGAAFKGLEFVIDVITSMGEAANKARDKMKAMAEETMNLRQEMRELAMLQGKDGPDDQVMAGAVEFGLATGMDPKKATRFLEQFYGSSPAGLEKHNVGDGIHQGETEEQYQQRVKPISEAIAKEAGQLGQRVKLDTKTAGDLGGVITQYGRIRNADEAAQKMGRVIFGLTEGRGNTEPLLRSLLNTAGAVVDDGNGPVAELEDLSAIQGAMSTHKNPRESGTYIRTAIRALRNFSAPQGEKLRELGISEETSHLEALHKVAAKVKTAGKPIDAALRDLGFKAAEDIESVTMEIKDVDIIDARLKKMQGISGEKVRMQNNYYRKQTLAGIRDQQQAQKAAQEFTRGIEAEAFQMARVQATTRMRDQGTLMGGTEQLYVDKINDAGGIKPALGIPSAFAQRVDENALNALMVGAENVGLGDKARELRQWVLEGGASGYEQREAEMFAELTPKILERKGDPFGGAGGTEQKVRAIGRTEAQKKAAEKARLPRPGAGPGGIKSPDWAKRHPPVPPGVNLGDALAPSDPNFKPDERIKLEEYWHLFGQNDEVEQQWDPQTKVKVASPRQPGPRAPAPAPPVGAAGDKGAASGHAATDMGPTNALLAQVLRAIQNQTTALKADNGPGMAPPAPGGFGAMRA